MRQGGRQGAYDPGEGERPARRITPTAEAADLAGCDTVIEAVFEDSTLKHKVFQEIENVVEPDALLCSNTSTLPITALAEGVQRQSDFIGLHFFSRSTRCRSSSHQGERTGEEALARAFDLVRRINKTPIVVNDSRGFFTSRVIGTSSTRASPWSARASSPRPSSRRRPRPAIRQGPLPDGRADADPAAEDPQRVQAGRRGVGGTWAPHPPRPSSTAWSTSSAGPRRSGGAASTSTAGRQARALWPGLREHSPSRAARSVRDMQERMLFSRRWTPSGFWRRAC